jgi:hypothetical protein
MSSWSADRSTLNERCDEPPVLTELDLLGRYEGEGRADAAGGALPRS